ncbi:MAG TPA: hypothetical protein VK539_18415 [Myxococcaceae bacterium]|nr:hypothetical protein [Myxococcaceae bacterium]
MTANLDIFPERQRLWEGVILGSVIHAIMVARYPELAHEQSWDGTNYNVQDSMGSRGTVSFSGNRVVGAFFDAKSPRNPFQSDGAYDVTKASRKMPSEHRRLAEGETFQYLLQEYQGKTVPIVTAAFWNEGPRLTAAEPWRLVYENGAHLLRRQLMEMDMALAEWRQAYGMSAPQFELARKLFEQKILNPGAPIVLSVDESLVVQAGAQGPEGLDTSRESFAEIGITLPG